MDLKFLSVVDKGGKNRMINIQQIACITEKDKYCQFDIVGRAEPIYFEIDMASVMKVITGLLDSVDVLYSGW
jgi:hypothetical protein